MSDEPTKPSIVELQELAAETIPSVRPPIYSLSDMPGGRFHSTLHHGSTKLPDWQFWRHMPEVKPWQACALAFNIDPDLMKRSSSNWMASGSDVFLAESFTGKEQEDSFNTLSRLLKANLDNKKHFTSTYPYNDLQLSEFSAWCIFLGLDVPQELSALAMDSPQAATLVDTSQTAKPEAVPVTGQSGGDWEAQARAIADECFDKDTKGECRDSLARKKGNKIVGGYSFRVMELMQERGIKASRGIIDNPATIMREALQGDKWWANKPK